MFNYLSSMTQWEPLHLASAATAPLGVPVTTYTYTYTNSTTNTEGSFCCTWVENEEEKKSQNAAALHF